MRLPCIWGSRIHQFLLLFSLTFSLDFLFRFALDPSQADVFFWISLAGVIFYGYKNVSSFVQSLQ